MHGSPPPEHATHPQNSLAAASLRDLLLFFCGRRLLLCIAGRSMQPTLRPGDRVLVKRLSSRHTPRSGSVVVVWHPQQTDLRLIQRLNRLERTGLWLLGFSLVTWFSKRSIPRRIKRLKRVEGAGMWLLGDNPAESTDSRQLGLIPRHLLIGEVVNRLPRKGSEQGR